MTHGSKANHIKLIYEIWPAMRHYTADDVSEEAAQIVDRVIDEIVRVYKPITIFSFILIMRTTVNGSPRELLKSE